MILPSKDFLAKFKAIPGALSVAEAIAIMNIADQAPKGTYMCLGAHKGKDSFATLQTIKSGDYYLVEPEFLDVEWEKYVLNQLKNDKGVNFIPIADYSTNVINNYGQYSYVFIDSGVHDDLVMTEVKMLEDKIVSGGILAFHDYLNQFTAVERAYVYALSTGKFERIDIDWKAIFDFVDEHKAEEGNNSWHQYPELPHSPNFIGALKRK